MSDIEHVVPRGGRCVGPVIAVRVGWDQACAPICRPGVASVHALVALDMQGLCWGELTVQAMDPATLELVRSHLRAVRVPGPADKVYKDECGFSFARPESLGGLYINLGSWQAYSEEWLDLDHQRTGQGLYLHELGTKVEPGGRGGC